MHGTVGIYNHNDWNEMRDGHMEWQLMDGECSSWAFGDKIRGIIRDRKAEVYFDEEKNPGWIWFAWVKDSKTALERLDAIRKQTDDYLHTYTDGARVRGAANNLSDAIWNCEKALGVIE